jgi:hypothetical protein
MAGRIAVGRRGRRAAVALVGLLTVTFATSCGGKSVPEIKGKLPLFPVKGKVMMDGQPMSGAIVILNPVFDFPAGAAQQRPRAKAEADGTFQLSTYANQDGAPAGKYYVTVSWKGSGAGLSSEQLEDLPEKAPESFQKPKTSKLIVQIKEGENTLPTWDLAEFERQASNNP